MAIYQIVEIGDDVLRQKAIKIREITPQVIKLLDNLRDTLKDSEVGVGLAAPQVGVSQRIIVLDVGEGPVVLVNPVIQSAQGEEIDVEGCLSIPERWVYVKRATQVVITGLNEKGKPVRIEADGYFARALQHEVDHLHGVLMLERMLAEAEVEQVESPVSEGAEE